jgi:RNA polymerase sigma-70 factor, ECF subfamily
MAAMPGGPQEGKPEGKEERILAVYRETIDALYRYVARNAGGDRSLAEDVAQETWLRAVREWRRKGPPDQPIAWLTTVARNLLASYYRRRRPAAIDPVSAADVLTALDAGRAAESSHISAVVCRALARLPEAQAQLLEAFHFEDRRMSQIAEACGLSERAVEGRLRRARESLRREVESLMKFEGGSR